MVRVIEPLSSSEGITRGSTGTGALLLGAYLAVASLLEQTIGRLKSSEQMRCPGCGIRISMGTNRLANATEEIRRAIEKVPPEITIKVFR
jgi:hypothetical protein